MITERHNAIGRLTGETRTGTNPFTASYTVDGAGNRTSQTIGGATTNFTLNSDDELTATSGGFVNSYSYSNNGEQTGRTLAGTAYSLSYDYDGQLTQITQGGNTTSFAYDALGRRYSRTAGGTTTQFHYAGSAVLLEKQGGTTTGVYSCGNGLLRRGGEYPLLDGSGSERTVTNSSQSVTGSINFEAFGQTAGSSGSSSSPYMFAGSWGYRTDGDAGLMKVGARYYDAQVGRFITRDALLSQHRYLYCEHEPVGYVDPSGHLSLTDLANSVGGVFGRITIIGAIGGVIERLTPPHTLAHKVGATLVGGSAIVTGIGMIAEGAITAPTPIAIITIPALVIGGDWVAVWGAEHIVDGWI